MSYKWLDPPEDVKWYKQIKPFSGKFEADWLLSLKLLRENGYPGVGWITWNDLDTDITNFLHFENNRWRINFQEDKACFQEISKEEAMASIAKKEEGVNPYIGKYIEALVDKPNGGNVKKGEVGKIKEEYRTKNGYIVSFPSQGGYYISKSDINGIKFKFVDEVEYSEKSPNLIAGRWYKVCLFNEYHHYIKIDRVDEDTVFLDRKGYIKNLVKWSEGISIDIVDITDIQLLSDLSEIQQYLPEGHPDKIEKEPEKSKFVPGDKVKINRWHYDPTRWKFPIYGEIVDTSSRSTNPTPIGIKIPGEMYAWWFKEEEIEHGEDPSLLKEPSTTPKFKKGDRVIGNAKANTCYGTTIEGWTGVVVTVFSDNFIRVKSDKDGEEYMVLQHCFDLITHSHSGIWQQLSGSLFTRSYAIKPEMNEGAFNSFQKEVYKSISEKLKDSSVFNEKDFLSKPFNQLLTIKTKTKCKK